MGYPRFPIHRLFERQAARTPEAAALTSARETVSFAQLNRRANRFARVLQARGVKPETFVGLCLERSLESVTAVLGILKAGGAYVYLDPSYPRRRLCEMAADAGLKLVITRPEVHNRIFGKAAGLEILDPNSGEIREADSENPDVEVDLDSAAYVIYTSGSTGKPKGAVEIHRSMTSRLDSLPLPDIQPADRCCLNSSLSSGITASRLFFPLVQGSQVFVLNDNSVKDVRRFVQCLDDYGITSVFMAPALLRRVLLLRERGMCRLESVRSVTVTGAALTQGLIQEFRRALPQALLVNVYGSTETGTTAALSVHRADSSPSPGSIGNPAPNTRIYVLNQELNPVRTGETGEICVASRNLAREYLNLPELTAQRFIANPFGGAGERLCRTGDLGRLLPNGEIQFSGRADHQVKIRGYRVELGEIEAALLADPQVLEAAVTAPGTGDERRLIAYLVGRGRAALDLGRIKQSLIERLPGYMVPSMFIRLSKLPVTPSGKVDRTALPEPPRAAAVAPDAEPRSVAEKAIARIFADLLHRSRVSAVDNFIELGGDSLGVAQFVAQVRGRFGVELSAKLVFDKTVRDLALEIASDRSPCLPASANCSQP